MQKSTKFLGSSKMKVCILGPTTKSDTPFTDNVVTKIYIILLEDIRTGIARNRLHAWWVFYIHVLDKHSCQN